MSDPYQANVSLLLPFEYSSFRPIDYSVNQKPIAPINGASKFSLTSKFYGNCVAFNGVGYIDVGPSQDFNFGTGDYTVEFWIKHDEQLLLDSFGYSRILSPRTSTNTTGGFQIWVKRDPGATYSASQRWSIEHATIDGTGVVTSTGVSTKNGQWNHIAFVRSGAESYCFMNGELKSQTTDATNYTLLATEGIRIGGRGDLNSNVFLAGFLQDLRITKGVARYTANFTPPSSFLSGENLSGTIKTTENFPKAGVTVRCIDRDPKLDRMWTTKTGMNGDYSFLLPKGDYTIIAQDDTGTLNDQVKRVKN